MSKLCGAVVTRPLERLVVCFSNQEQAYAILLLRNKFQIFQKIPVIPLWFLDFGFESRENFFFEDFYLLADVLVGLFAFFGIGYVPPCMDIAYDKRID